MLRRECDARRCRGPPPVLVGSHGVKRWYYVLTEDLDSQVAVVHDNHEGSWLQVDGRAVARTSASVLPSLSTRHLNQPSLVRYPPARSAAPEGDSNRSPKSRMSPFSSISAWICCSRAPELVPSRRCRVIRSPTLSVPLRTRSPSSTRRVTLLLSHPKCLLDDGSGLAAMDADGSGLGTTPRISHHDWVLQQEPNPRKPGLAPSKAGVAASRS